MHFVSESDRPTNAPYTVHYSGGSKTYTVDQTGDRRARRVEDARRAPVRGRDHRQGGARRRRRQGGDRRRGPVHQVGRGHQEAGHLQRVEHVPGPQRGAGLDQRHAAPTTDSWSRRSTRRPRAAAGRSSRPPSTRTSNARRDYNLPKLVLTLGPAGRHRAPADDDHLDRRGADLAGVRRPVHGGRRRHRRVPGAPQHLPDLHAVGGDAGRAGRQDAPVLSGHLGHTDADRTRPTRSSGHFYYYMVAVKTADGQVVAGPTQGALLPKAGQITRIFRETAANQVPDTTLSRLQPNTNVNVYDGDPYVSAGNNSSLLRRHPRAGQVRQLRRHPGRRPGRRRAAADVEHLPVPGHRHRRVRSTCTG